MQRSASLGYLDDCKKNCAACPVALASQRTAVAAGLLGLVFALAITRRPPTWDSVIGYWCTIELLAQIACRLFAIKISRGALRTTETSAATT